MKIVFFLFVTHSFRHSCSSLYYRTTLDHQKNLPNAIQTEKQQQQQQQQQESANEKKKPHIKKPLNAFMLYMKEMRAKVVAECTLKESAAINQILGRRVSFNLLLYFLHNPI